MLLLLPALALTMAGLPAIVHPDTDLPILKGWERVPGAIWGTYSAGEIVYQREYRRFDARLRIQAIRSDNESLHVLQNIVRSLQAPKSTRAAAKELELLGLELLAYTWQLDEMLEGRRTFSMGVEGRYKNTAIDIDLRSDWCDLSRAELFSFLKTLAVQVAKTSEPSTGSRTSRPPIIASPRLLTIG
jgi:hypothetical protein